MARKDSMSSKASTRILVVDDHPIVREGLIKLLQREPDLMACAEADTAAEALQAVTTAKPDLVLLDLSLRSGSGLELMKDLKLRYPQLPVLVLSMHDETVYAERALRAGAKGYLMKDKAKENIIQAVRAILGGELYLSPRMAQTLLVKAATGEPAQGTSPVDVLSDRELEVFRLLGQGLGTKEIAARLARSVKTIDAHRENIKRKLNLANASDLLQSAIRWMQSETPR